MGAGQDRHAEGRSARPRPANYAAASRGFPKNTGLDDDNEPGVQGKSGIVELARGEYVDALDKLYPVAPTYWGDVAHIAERVLTVDELKNFVDANAAAMPFKSAAVSAGLPPRARLRDLLARRLMREGRYDEALDYFYDPGTRKIAAAYADALHEADSDWGRVDRAEALFRAASLARNSGIDIMGTETPPDVDAWEGDFDIGFGQAEVKGPFTTPGERARFAASKPKPDLRFHYRYVAADEANSAADLLPPRSQAFAVVLCDASLWMAETPGENPRVHAIYRRYLKQGAYVRWGKDFGVKCPAPDFAARFRWNGCSRSAMRDTSYRFIAGRRWVRGLSRCC